MEKEFKAGGPITSAKLLSIAAWLDILSSIAVDYIDFFGRERPEYEEARKTLLGTDVQDDLRRWASEMKGVQ